MQNAAFAQQEQWNARLLAEGAALPPPGAVPIERIRRNRIEGGGGRPAPQRVDEAVDTTIGGLSARLFVPAEARAIYLHLHGGGWVFGSIWEQDAMLWRLAQTARVAVVSIAYRLAPEDPHPAAADDAERAALWLAEHGVDRFGSGRLLIGGESAGAHLAALTLLRLRDRHSAADAVTAAQLSYGIYDLGMTPSQKKWRDRTLVLDTAWLEWFYEQFLPGLDDKERRDPGISPLYADLRDLPAALFTVGTEDPLLDDTLRMATAWELAGNRSELAVYPHGPHGLNAYPTPLGRAAQQRITQFLAHHATQPAATQAPDPLEVARQWRSAVERNDMAAFRELYHPDARIWTSVERRDRPVDQHVRLVSAARAPVSDWTYEVLRSERTSDGFFAEQRVHLTFDGKERVTVAAVVGRVEHGKIVHLAEYFNRTVESLD